MAETNIVRDFRIGNTRIKIADDYCRKTAAEVDDILRRIAQQAQRHISAAAGAGSNECERTNEANASNDMCGDCSGHLFHSGGVNGVLIVG